MDSKPLESRQGRLDQINRPEYEALRTVLSEAMASSGIGQRELSRKLGKPHVYIFRILAGKRTLEFSELLDICDGIGANPAIVFKEAIRRSRASMPQGAQASEFGETGAQSPEA